MHGMHVFCIIPNDNFNSWKNVVDAVEIGVVLLRGIQNHLYWSEVVDLNLNPCQRYPHNL